MLHKSEVTTAETAETLTSDLAPYSHLLFKHDVSALIRKHVSFSAQLQMSRTSKYAKDLFFKRWGTPKSMYLQLLNMSPEQIQEVQSKLPRDIYKNLHKIIKNKKNKDNHIAYVCWCLMTDDVMSLDLARMIAALDELQEMKSAQHLIDSMKKLIELHRLTLLANDSTYSRNEFYKRVVGLLKSIQENKSYFNASNASIAAIIMIPHQMLDSFGGIQLKRANIEHHRIGTMHLRNKNFENANLKGSAIKQASFTGSNFKKANLSYAKFDDCDFQNANFIDADLSHALFKVTRMDECVILGAFITTMVLIVIGIVMIPLLISILTDNFSLKLQGAKFFEKINDSAELKKKLDMFATVQTTYRKEFRDAIRKDMMAVLRRDYAAGVITAADAQRYLQEAQNHPFFATHRNAPTRLKCAAARQFSDKYKDKNYKLTNSQKLLMELSATIGAQEAAKQTVAAPAA